MSRYCGSQRHGKPLARSQGTSVTGFCANSEERVTRLRLRSAALALCAALMLISSTVAVGAVNVAPAAAADSCSTNKLDIFFQLSDAPSAWTNTCGTGVVWEEWAGTAVWGCPYLWISDVYQGCTPRAATIGEIRFPFAPYHRIWFHQNVDGSGWSHCFYSTNIDIYVYNFPAEYASPGNILVSDNTSPC
jgi:hypothetical protein